MDVVATIKQLTYFAVDEAGLSRVKIDILESFDNLWGHGSTFLQVMRPGYVAESNYAVSVVASADYTGESMLEIGRRIT